jgi:hypothetical protein
MSQSIDFRINDFINEYLDYKGYTKTVETFLKERQDRKEPINKNGNLYEKEQEKNLAIKVLYHKKTISFSHFIFIRKKC